jgi:argonaute-like protein implicated in RNA metabolism and viral defense
MWTQGLIPTIGSPPGYYKEGKGIPQPLLITRFAGRGDFYDLCRETLALTKMNWNNDGPYTQMPVTLKYADILGQIVERMPKLDARPYPIRLFM